MTITGTPRTARPSTPNDGPAAPPRRAARRRAAAPPPPARRRNDQVALQKDIWGHLHPQEARHGQGGGVPFLDLDEAAVAVSGFTKTGAMLINAFASGIALLGAWSAASELHEASEELPELDAQRQALAALAPTAPGAHSADLLQSAQRNHLAAQRRVTAAHRTAVAKAALCVPSCIGALTMGLSVLLGPDLLGAVYSTAKAAAILMHIAVPSIGLFGVGSALLHGVQALRQRSPLAALRRLQSNLAEQPGNPQTRLHALAAEAVAEQRTLRHWRVAASVAGAALGLGVVLAFWVGPVGLALLLPGALALPACNAVIAARTHYAAPSRPDHVPHARVGQAPTFFDAADAHTYAGSLRDLANTHAAAQQERRICAEVPLARYSAGRVRRAWAGWRQPHASTPEGALAEAYTRILEARLVTSRRSADAGAVAQAVAQNQRALQALNVEAAPWHTLNTVLHTLNAEDAVAPFMARLHRVAALKAHLPEAHEGALLLTSTQVRRAVEKLPTSKQAACIRELCRQALHALVRTVQADAEARERQAMSQFVTVAELS